MKKLFLALTLTACAVPVKVEAPEPPKVDAFYPCPEKDFWWAVEEAESSHNPKTIYKESDGTISAGLYQLSVTDGKYYGCDFKVLADVLDPVKNTACKDKIAARLRVRYPGLSYQLSLGKYWGTLRGNDWGKDKRPKGWGNVVKAAAKRGCVLPL